MIQHSTAPDENGNIAFELKEGIFKAFCEKVNGQKIDPHNFDSAWNTFLHKIEDNDAANPYPLKTSSGKKLFYVSINSSGNLSLYTGMQKNIMAH